MLNNFKLKTNEDIIDGLNVSVVEVSGHVDTSTFPELQDHLQKLVDDGKVRIIVELGQLEYISSAGMGVLMGLLQETRNQGGDLKLANMSEKIRHLFDILGFSRLVRIYPDVHSAKQAFFQDEDTLPGEEDQSTMNDDETF